MKSKSAFFPDADFPLDGSQLGCFFFSAFFFFATISERYVVLSKAWYNGGDQFGLVGQEGVQDCITSC